MKFTVPTNWQDDLLDQINSPEITEVYGKLTADFIGGGKHSFQTPKVYRKRIECHIKKIHQLGLKFNYLLNATCIDNLELTIPGHKQIIRLLDWLVKIDVDAVTVSIPYLLEFIKRNYPYLKIYVSTLASVNSLERAKYWENLGADKITLLNTDCNRNFSLLKNFKKNIKCELQLIANVNCLHHCPFYLYHANLASHSSQTTHKSKGFVIDYCRMSCRYKQILNPAEIIRSQWIRPEDIHYYEDIGVDYLKLIDRGMNNYWISSISKAYINRKYEGNLMDLFPDPSKTLNFTDFKIWHKIKYFFRPELVNVFRFLKQKELIKQPHIYIDNRLLDNFLQFFLENDCHATSCVGCHYCEDYANKTIRTDSVQQKEAVEKYERCLKDIISGRLFKYS